MIARARRRRPSLRARLLWLSLAWQQLRRPPMARAGYLAAREDYEQLARAMGVPPDVASRRQQLGHLAVDRLRPAGAEDRTVLYLHGGAYVMGSLDASREGACRVGRAGRAEVVNVGYRLAPEHPFPAAVDDALAAYRWVLEQVAGPERLAVVGSSAGGGLAVAMLQAAREAGLPQPAGLVTVSAWTDLRCTAWSYADRARRDPALTPQGLRAAADLYLAGASPAQPLASPVLGDLRGLPPTLALVGTEEVLLHDTVALVEQLRAAGVDARSLIGHGMVHCWTGFSERVPEAAEALAAVGRFLRTTVRT